MDGSASRRVRVAHEDECPAPAARRIGEAVEVRRAGGGEERAEGVDQRHCTRFDVATA